ncbi:hypothetical protein LTR27_010160 [Elasticomyces elasticus]|nr:hypothetical protein LTR27_010160 [Elasticomyces elasticus]
MVHNLLNQNVAKSYVPYQMLENKQMLYDLLHTPDDFLKHIRRYSNALTTTMVFGWRTPTYENASLKQLFEGFSEFAEINQTGTAALIDFFPALRMLPDFVLPTQGRAKELHKHEKALYLGHWLNAKQAVKDGTIKPCFCVGLRDAQEKEGFSDDQASYITGTLLEAGSDTTSNTLYAFVLAMLLYPEAQKKAQEEIDRVVGDTRLPTMDDEPNLQFIRGEQVSVCSILNNVWSINMDPNRAPDPRRFDPSRHKDDLLTLYDSAVDPDVSKRDQFTFGAGRRICPGMHVAERSLFLGMSRFLWAFDLEPATDSEGKTIIPDQDKLTQGFVCMPEEFPAKITPRSPARAEVVEREWRVAEGESLNSDTKQWLA